MTRGEATETDKKEFNLDPHNRHMMAIQKQQEDTTSFLRIVMWIILFVNLLLAYLTRITWQDGKLLVRKALIKCRIVKDNLKKTKYS